jgi:UDP-GlcNAc:undecaprenyl-phosphate GlcNAc-1-phosphate transferase
LLLGIILSLLAGTTIVFAIGLYDDLRELSPAAKLAGQLVAACVLLLAGVRVDVGSAPPLAAVELALTGIWVVGLTNAFNLLDNMDGLSAGVATIAASMLALASLATGDATVALLSLVAAGAAAGFLVHNFPPARIFMGDSGSLTLGFLLAALALMGSKGLASDLFFALLVPIAILGLPIFDTSLVAITRRLHGRPISLGGRDHLSHRLVALGLSERGAVLVLYLLSLSFGMLGLAARDLGEQTALAVTTLGLVAVMLFGVYLGQVPVYAEEPAPRGRAWWWAHPELGVLALDGLLIAIAYLLAYLLKFEGNLSGPFLRQFQESLPYLVVVKLVVLLASGAYRPLWRYFNTGDAFHLALASTLGSAIVGVGVWIVTRWVEYSRSVFVIDWLLCTLLLVSARLFYAWLAERFAVVPRAECTRVLILGADDHGDLVLRTLWRLPSYQAVGFLDPAPGKQRRRLRGLSVLGTPRDLHAVTLATGAHAVVVATPLPAGPEQDRFVRLCQELGLDCRDAATFVREQWLEVPAPVAPGA